MTRYLKCCSLVENWEIMVKTESPPGTIGCLHGLRCLAMANIVLCHFSQFALLEGGNITFLLITVCKRNYWLPYRMILLVELLVLFTSINNNMVIAITAFRQVQNKCVNS